MDERMRFVARHVPSHLLAAILEIFAVLGGQVSVVTTERGRPRQPWREATAKP
jgi:hypothetical protein